MAMNKDKETTNYPMISESTWWALRKKFIQTLPARVTDNSLASLLNMGTRSVSINVLSPLRKMGLIDSEGRTTELAKRWRDDDQYPLVCKEIRQKIYPSELLDTFPASDSSRTSIEKWFANEAGVGESAKGKMAKTYLLLAEGDPTKQDKASSVAKLPKSNKVVPLQIKPPHKQVRNVVSEKSNGNAELLPTSEKNAFYSSSDHAGNIAPSLHIDIQIHIPPEASAEQIDHIFESMTKHLYKGSNGHA